MAKNIGAAFRIRGHCTLNLSMHEYLLAFERTPYRFRCIRLVNRYESYLHGTHRLKEQAMLFESISDCETSKMFALWADLNQQQELALKFRECQSKRMQFRHYVFVYICNLRIEKNNRNETMHGSKLNARGSCTWDYWTSARHCDWDHTRMNKGGEEKTDYSNLFGFSSDAFLQRNPNLIYNRWCFHVLS